jgi:hypothetical protein
VAPFQKVNKPAPFDQFMWRLNSKNEVRRLAEYKKVLEPKQFQFKTAKVTIDIDGVPWNLSGQNDLPDYLEIKKAVIHGLLKRDLIITNQKRMIMAPYHHNMANIYAMDLMASNDLSVAERQELNTMGARYMYISDGGDFTYSGIRMIGYISNNGDVTKLFEGQDIPK